MARVAWRWGLCAVLLAVALGGCWRATGRPSGLDAPGLLEAAREAHERGDLRACRTLLGRLVEQSPTSEQAAQARAWLAALEDPTLLPAWPSPPASAAAQGAQAGGAATK
jgi:hypothetical protein